MSSLSIQNIHKTYPNGIEVLKGINIDIEAGQFLILVGGSGCGKSTLLNIIAGLETISSGEIHIDGCLVNGLSPKERDIAMVFQSYALYPSMTVRQNIAFGLGMRKVPKTQQHHTIQRVSEMLQIGHLLDRKPSQLSGGQRQRVAMGRALARNPKMFLFDEPLSNLDAKLRIEMRTEIKRMHQQLGTTIVYVTHDQTEAMTLGDRIAVMKDGVVQQFGSPQQIYDNPHNLFVAEFMGSPSMNFIPGKIIQHQQHIGLACTGSEGNFVLELPIDAQNATELINRDVILGIRPENITDELTAHDTHAQTIHLRIELTEPTGPDTLVTFTLNNTTITARTHPKTALRPNEMIPLCFDVSKALLFDPITQARIALCS
ncbi:MAG: sn-glycerol-3-phosphate ABC transporter ATP-binding protein UgpC [Ottowia sp.]|nr:sn-glycerol-3-phosphate ABC transporter ATP-binding protein UgpC [Ottowia sp.]